MALRSLTAEFEMGSGSGHAAQATRPAHRNLFGTWPCRVLRRRVSGSASMWWQRLLLVFAVTGSCARHPPCSGCRSHSDTDHESDQANRAISTGRLNASPRLHPRPIDVVVFHGPQGRSRFKGGFPLRCLQRLSRPYVAMLHCRWRDNSSTRGTFIPVLSY